MEIKKPNEYTGWGSLGCLAMIVAGLIFALGGVAFLGLLWRAFKYGAGL